MSAADTHAKHHHLTLFPRVRLAELLMLASSLAFASMVAVSHGLADRCDWRFVLIARSALAFLITFPIAKSLKCRLVFPGPKTLWVRSIVGSLGMLASFYAYTHLPITGSVTLLNTFPLWVAALSWPVLGVRPSLGIWVAIASGLAGVVLVAQSYGGGAGSTDGSWFAIVIALSGACCTAVVMFGLSRLRGLNPYAIAVHFAGVATITCVVYALVTHTNRPLSFTGLGETGTLLLLTCVGVLGSLGQILMTTAFQHGPADRLATLGLTQVVFAVGFDMLIWGHEFSVWLCLGIFLVLAPAVWLIAQRRRISRT